MKKPLVLFVFLLIGMSFRPDAPSPKENPSGKRMKENFRIYTNHLETNLEKIKEHIESESPPVVLRSEFKRAREDYKFLEAMVAHLFPSFDLDFNAKPVFKLNTDAAVVSLVEPHGLQVLELALFRDEDYVKAKAEVEFMLERLPELQKRIHRIQYQDRFAFEAVRQEVIRITTLGITGFDSRVLKHSIPETIEALKSIQFLMEPYLDFMTKYNKNLVYDLRNRIYGAIEFCGRNSEFELFNRAEFIRDYMEPIYADIHQLHLEIGVETKDEVHQFVEPINYEAKHMFSSELFDPYAFSEKSFAPKNPKIEELGALLFFDPVLSQNNKRACASCHNPTKGFADGLKKSPSINFVGTLKRNSPSLWNAAYVHDLFWDLRSGSLNDQIDHVTNSPLEFNLSFEEILEKVRKSDDYVKLFEEAFEREDGGEVVSGTKLKQALSQYVRTLSAFDSPMDRYLRGDTSEVDFEIKHGFNLFMGKGNCGSCHFAPLYSGTLPPKFMSNGAEVTGVPKTNENKELDDDWGCYGIWKFDYLKAAFKTPGLRNVELTAPYMHNGAYENLEEVVHFYNRGGGAGMGLDVPNQTLASDSLNLTPLEVRRLVLFMKSLTDTSATYIIPDSLPKFASQPDWNARKIGGEY